MKYQTEIFNLCPWRTVGLAADQVQKPGPPLSFMVSRTERALWSVLSGNCLSDCLSFIALWPSFSPSDSDGNYASLLIQTAASICCPFLLFIRAASMTALFLHN